MKQKNFKYLAPVGSEIILPSSKAVSAYFANCQYNGKIGLYEAEKDENKIDDDEDIFQVLWLNEDFKDKLLQTAVFKDEQTKLFHFVAYYPLRRGDVFIRNNHYYQVCWSQNEGLLIKEITIISSEEELLIICDLLGLKNISIQLCKIFDPYVPNKLIEIDWIVKANNPTNENEELYFFNVFCEGYGLLSDYDTTQVGRFSISAGNSFYYQHIFWNVISTNKGLKIQESPIKMSILKSGD